MIFGKDSGGGAGIGEIQLHCSLAVLEWRVKCPTRRTGERHVCDRAFETTAALPGGPKRKTRAADVPHRSVSGAVFMIVHSDFDLDAGLHDREFAGKRCDQFRSRLELLRPKRCLPASSRWTA